jgi:hypothetical protein
MENNIQKLLTGILAVSVLTASLTGCSVKGTVSSQLSNSSTSQSESFLTSQPGQEAYSLEVPEEGWTQVSVGMWAALKDSQVLTSVRTWVVSFEGQTAEQARESLAADDYQPDGETIQREKDGVISKVSLYESKGDTWGLFYSYPSGEAEQWETELSAIVETFQLSSN